MSNKIFRFDKNPAKKINASLLYVSKAKYEDDWHSTKHLHPFTELFYVIEGEGLFKINNDQYKVKNDDLVIVNSNIHHTESSHKSKPLEYFVLGIDGIALNSSRDENLVINDKENEKELFSINNYANNHQQILFYLKEIYLEAKSAKKNHQAICQNLLEVLILNLNRNLADDFNLKEENTKVSKDSAYIKKYIDTHYANDLNLDQLAAESYMNKYYLVHNFKNNFGQSPIDYLIEKRISVAKTLLETTKNPIGEISQIVGFNSQSYFSQIFKKKSSLTPSQYRKNN